MRRGLYVYFLGGIECEIPLDWLVASDWEVVEEPKPERETCRYGAECDVNGQCGSDKVHELRVMVRERDATVARLKRELAEARSPCMCVSSSVHARCAMPGGHPGKIHTDGSYVWLV